MRIHREILKRDAFRYSMEGDLGRLQTLSRSTITVEAIDNFNYWIPYPFNNMKASADWDSYVPIS